MFSSKLLPPPTGSANLWYPAPPTPIDDTRGTRDPCRAGPRDARALPTAVFEGPVLEEEDDVLAVVIVCSIAGASLGAGGAAK